MTAIPPPPRPGDTIDAITLYQPWASLVALGEKTVETRDWWTSKRGWIAIHAGKHFPQSTKQLCGTRPFLAVLARHDLVRGFGTARNGFVVSDHALPLGAVLCVAYLADAVRTEDRAARDRLALRPYEEAFGNYGPNRFAHLFASIRPFVRPLKQSGSMGFWKWTVPTDAEYEDLDAMAVAL